MDPDKLLGSNLSPQGALTAEANFFKTQEYPIGIQLDPRTINNPPITFTKADWEPWTAASSNDPALTKNIVHRV